MYSQMHIKVGIMCMIEKKSSNTAETQHYGIHQPYKFQQL